MIKAIWLPSSFAFFSSTIALIPSFATYALGLLGVVIFLFDIHGRLEDYFTLREKLRVATSSQYIRLLKRYSRTACGRQVMIACRPTSRMLYHDMGYRWYHILPDDALTMRSPFLKLNFWLYLGKGHKL